MRRGPTVAIALLFAVVFPGYLALWQHNAPVLEGDSPQYLAVARDLADLRLDSLHDRSPGYPLLLVLTGSAGTPGRVLVAVSLVLHLCSVSMLALLLRRSHVPSLMVWLFCAVLVLPPFVEPAGYVMTENLAQFTLAAGLTALVLWCSTGRATLLAIAAFAFGYSALTRPTYQALAPAIAIALVTVVRTRAGLSVRQALTASLGLAAGTAVVLATVASANYAVTGYFGIVPTAGIHLSTKTMNFVERLPDDYAAVREILIRERDAQLTQRGGTHTGTQTIWTARDAIASETGLSKPELSRYLLRMNIELIRKAPIEYLQEVARSVATYWFPASGPLATMGFSPLRWLWALLHGTVLTAFVIPLVVFAGLGLHTAAARLRGLPPSVRRIGASPEQLYGYLVALVIVVYTMALSCFFDIGEVRQRRPTDVLIAFLALQGMTIWMQSFRSTEILPGEAQTTPWPPAAGAEGRE